MIDWLIDFFTTLSTNPMATGILGSTLVGGLIYLGRSIPVKIWFWFWDSVTTNIDFVQENSPTAYRIIEEELEHCKLRCLAGTFQLIFKRFSKETDLAIGTSGIFLTKIFGKWAMVQKYTDRQVALWHSFVYNIRFFTRDKDYLDKKFNEAYNKQITLSRGDNFKVFQYIEKSWYHLKKPKIFMPKNLPPVKQQICDKIEYFLNNREEYLKHGKPWHEGFVLSGPPGTGKSYFVQQIASKFSLNISYFNLDAFPNNETFIKAMLEVSFPSIILFEDIDCSKISHVRAEAGTKEAITEALDPNKKEGYEGVSLSTLLNVLDGLLAQEGQICVLTTNHIEKLDPALIRAGRFKINAIFEKLTGPEICEIVSKNYETEIDLKLDNLRMSIAEVTDLCSSGLSIDEVKRTLINKNNEQLNNKGDQPDDCSD